MVINATYLAHTTRSCESSARLFTKDGDWHGADRWAAASWADAKRRVLASYRQWLRAVSRCRARRGTSDVDADDVDQAPEIQTMYSLNKPVAELRTKMRQEFERHRYVSQLSVVDVLLFQNHAEFQVGFDFLVLVLDLMS